MQEYIQFPFTDINTKKIYDHHGFWLVDKNKAFKNKNTALAYCSKNKTKDIKFCLYDDIFEHVSWHIFVHGMLYLWLMFLVNSI